MLRAQVRVFILRRQLKRARREVSSVQARLRSAGVSDEEAAVPIVAAVREAERIEAEIEKIRTGRLVLKAIRLGIDPPPTDWLYTRYVYEPNQITSVSTLTKLGESKLRRNILVEQRMRWEFWLKLVPPIVIAATGLLGTLIGVLAILKSSNK